MKTSFAYFLILYTLAFQTTISFAQETKSVQNAPPTDIDSTFKEAQNAVILWQQERALHKDTQDSAWMNDFEGHTKYDARTNSKEAKSITVIDSATSNYYVLDSTHTIITAYMNSSKMIWQTNPRIAHSLPEYRHKNPVITYFKLGVIDSDDYKLYTKGDKVLFIGYSNSQFGFLDLKTGKFTFEGQD